MLGPIISENDPPFFAPWVTSTHISWKKSEVLCLSSLWCHGMVCDCGISWSYSLPLCCISSGSTLFVNNGLQYYNFQLRRKGHVFYIIINWASAWDFQQCGMRDQQCLRPACAYAQSDQSLCRSLEYSTTVKLLTEHHLAFLSLHETAQARLSLHLSKRHIVGNHMSQLIFILPLHFPRCL